MRIHHKCLSVALGACAVVVCAFACRALTVTQEVTAAYIREHPKEFSVQVTKSKEGLLQFKITHDVSEPKYHVAHLSVVHQGKLIAESSTPSYGQKHGNTFYFSLAPEDIADSKFELSDSILGKAGDEMVPLPGTIDYQFRLADFAPNK
ncbi:MAG TPA: hypothetical protein VKX17_26575 [Planctomycetota bacterium]|nr:hypothetical protein [Planctomycetota bacterium]